MEGRSIMVTMNTIHQVLGSTVCRRCICKRFKVNLEPSDCEYGMYPSPCSSCGNVHNIVIALRTSGKLKLLLK